MASQRSRGRVPNRYGQSVAPCDRASEVRVYDVATGALLRIEEPLRPRKQRSTFEAHSYGEHARPHDPSGDSPTHSPDAPH